MFKRSQCSSETQCNSIKLERIKFRIFDGDVRKYPKFKSELIKFVAPLCPESQLTFVLKSYLCESVCREVENIDHNLDAMWKRLDKKYGAVHKLIDCILSDIKNMPNCDNRASTLDMIRLVETAHSNLQCIDALSELQNVMIISVIEKSMSPLMSDEWVKLVAGKQLSSEAKFSKLMSFLHECKRMIEYENADIRMPTVQSNATNYRSPPSATVRRCLVHRNHEHPIWRCRTFRAMSVKERLGVIKLNNACMLCLETGHHVNDCKRSFKCSITGCNSAHNVLLHDVNH